MGRRLLSPSGAVVCCLVAIAFAAADARADIDPLKEEAEFLKGRDAYVRHDYLEAQARFEAMTKPGGEQALRSPAKLDDAYMYLAATYLALGKKDQANEQLRRLLLDAVRRGADYDPDQLTFSQDVLDAFRDAKTRYRAEILAEKERKAREEQETRDREAKEKVRQKKYLEALERQAAEETIITKNSRWLTLVPFGAGQFQNGQRALGWTLLASETVLTAAVAVTTGFYVANLGQYLATKKAAPCGYPRVEPCFANDLAASYYNRTLGWGYANMTVSLALATAMIAGVVQANLTFVPETHGVRPRALPQISLGLGYVGVEGRF